MFNAIAPDIGVKRYEGEREAPFCNRVAYSAARFWVSAFCMDDGADGKKGLSKQAMNRRLKGWVQALEEVRPGMKEWFDASSKGIPAIYKRLIDVGDLAPNGFDNAYFATRPRIAPLSEGLSCVTGFFDATGDGDGSCGRDAGSVVTSGLLSLVNAGNGTVGRPEPWWVTDIEYMPWEKGSNYGELRFADFHTSRWNINRSDVWVDKPEWVGGLSLARVEGASGDFITFVAKQTQNHLRLSRITWIQGQELFFHLRDEVGNGAIARYAALDKLHARAILPIGFVPGHINRFLDAMGWPVEDAYDRFNRVVRIEALPAIRELLAASSIGLEEIRDGGK